MRLLETAMFYLELALIRIDVAICWLHEKYEVLLQFGVKIIGIISDFPTYCTKAIEKCVAYFKEIQKLWTESQNVSYCVG